MKKKYIVVGLNERPIECDTKGYQEYFVVGKFVDKFDDELSALDSIRVEMDKPKRQFEYFQIISVFEK